MNHPLLSWGDSAERLLDRMLEAGLWLAAGFVMVYSFVGFAG
jgi:hypothetical protein